MASRQWFVKLFNIRPDESKPVLFLMIFSFFVGLSMTFYFAASNAIFLKHFQSWMISLSYMASGIIVWAAWWLLSRLDRRLTLTWQLIVKFLFVFVTVTAISIGVWMYDSSWLVFIMFTWIRVLVYITLVTFWGLAGKLFNIRQGKRVFGLLGIGEVISIIIGYFSVPFILKFLKAPDLLFLSSGSLLICLVFVFVILRTFRNQLSDNRPSSFAADHKEKTNLNYWKLVKKPYFMLISLMALLPIFGYLFVDFLFLAQTKNEFANNPETIAGFFGIFLGFVAIIELVFKLISGRFLNKYGLKPSLISLPLILLSAILMAAVSGTLFGTVGLFFAFIALARLFERSVRAAIYEPAFQLLYQPVPSAQRMIFQNQIEGIPKASGTVITGAVILLFSTIHTFNLVNYSWIFIVVLSVWIWIAFRMYDNYRNMLKTKLSELKTENTDSTSPVKELIKQSLVNAETDQFDKVFGIFINTYPLQTEEALLDAYSLSPTSKRLLILQKISDNQIVSAVQFLRSQAEVQQAGELLSSVNQTIDQLQNKSNYVFENILELCQSRNPAERHRAACLLGSSGRYDTYKLLISLLKDNEPSVRRTAIISGSKTKRVELWPFIIDNLVDSRYAGSARIGLQLIGEPVLTELDRLFEKSDGVFNTKQLIISVFESVGGSKSIKFLRSKMFYPDKDIRKNILSALSRLGYHASITERTGIKNYIEETIENILWIQASMQDISKTNNANTLQIALLDELEGDKEYVFMLLGLLYESKTIRHIRENIESKDINAKVYALEIGDMLIEDDIKQIFFPLFEDITIQERLQRFENKFPHEQMEPLDRLFDILNRDFSKSTLWTKACAIELLGRQHTDNVEGVTKMLAANIVHPHFLIGELSAWALSHFDTICFIDTMIRLKKNDNPAISLIADNIKAREKKLDLLLFEKVLEIKSIDIFSDINENDIIDLLGQHPEIQFVNNGMKTDTNNYTPVNQQFNSENGYSITFTDDILYELVIASAIFAEKYLTSVNIKPLNEGL